MDLAERLMMPHMTPILEDLNALKATDRIAIVAYLMNSTIHTFNRLDTLTDLLLPSVRETVFVDYASYRLSHNTAE